MNIIKSFLLLIAILFCFDVVSQTSSGASISGEVIDSLSNTPLPNANVLIANTNIGATTNKNGFFEIKNLSAGIYLLKIHFIGYKIFTKKINLKNNQKLFLKIKLSDSIITSSTVVIKAVKEDAKSVIGRENYVKAKSIEAAPLQNISGLMDYIPGVNVSNTSGIFSSKTVVSVRGLPANDQSRTLVVMDGVVLNKSDLGSVNWNVINKNNIEEIKVVKGPGSAKYGSGAMGGVVEITSKKPSDKLSANAMLSYGTFNTLTAGAGLSNSLKNKNNLFYWNLSGLARKSDGYISEPEQFMEEADTILVPVFLKEINTNTKIGYIINKKHTIEAEYSFFDDKRGTGVKVFEDDGAFSSHLTHKALLRYSAFNDNSKWNLIAFYSSEFYNRMYEYMNEGEYSLYMADSKREDKGFNFDYSFNKYKNHNISSGINYKAGSVNGADIYFTSTDKVLNAGKIDNIAFYLQDEIKLLSDNLSFNAGLRYDIAKFSNGLFNIENPSYTLIFYENFENKNIESKQWDAISPRLSLNYMFSPKISSYISFAKGFRAPVLDDMSRTGKKRGGFKIANPDLGPESIYSYEWGGDIKILKNFSASLSVYYSIGKDFMYYTSNGDTVNMGYKLAPVVTKQNIGKVEIYGAETEIKYDFAEFLSLFANYSFTNATIIEHKVKDVAVDSNLTGKYLTDIPQHKISAGLIWKNKIVNSSLLYKFVGKTWINDLNSVDEEYLLTDQYPSYSLFSLRFSKLLFKKYEIALNIENVFDKIFIDGDVQRNPGRFITLSAKFQIL